MARTQAKDTQPSAFKIMKSPRRLFVPAALTEETKTWKARHEGKWSAAESGWAAGRPGHRMAGRAKLQLTAPVSRHSLERKRMTPRGSGTGTWAGWGASEAGGTWGPVSSSKWHPTVRALPVFT